MVAEMSYSGEKNEELEIGDGLAMKWKEMEVKAEAMTLKGEELRRSSLFKGFRTRLSAYFSKLGRIWSSSHFELQ